ncbi:MAG: leucine-rich repeat protein [Lachnospiraceae bacterium]|nr:leucine-rich repeat protein [Lachnospiraceae bacterium]
MTKKTHHSSLGKFINKKRMTFFSLTLFLASACFLIYYLGIQPYYSKKVTDKYRNMYYSANSQNINSSILLSDNSTKDLVPPLISGNYIYEASADSVVTESETMFDVSLDDTATKGAVDSNGMLLKFAKLYEYNSDIRGWLRIDGTDVDYPVLQATGGSDFYLTHDFEGNKDKNGSLYIDGSTHLNAKNLVIHGHNMKSTGMMFHELEKYSSIDYYAAHPYFTFDSLYDESKWAIISVMKVPGDFASNDSFNYIRSSFNSSDEYLNFLYELKMRSLYNIPISVNEYDSLVMLSTCSYEINDYRTVIVARKIRKKEKLHKIKEFAKSATINRTTLYSDDWYRKYGGKAPVKTTFMDAYSFGEINWYDGSITPINPIGHYVMEAQEVNNISMMAKDSSANMIFKILSCDSVSFAGILTADTTSEILSLQTTKDNLIIYTDAKVKAKNIEEVVIPDSITINNREFKVEEIEHDAFTNLTHLTSVNTGNNTVLIPDKAFVQCPKLNNIVIGKSTQSIGRKALFGLKNLKTVKIKSNKIKEIGEKAFPDKKKFKYKIKYSRDVSKKVKQRLSLVILYRQCY